MIDLPVLEEKADDKYHNPQRAMKPTLAWSVSLLLMADDQSVEFDVDPCVPLAIPPLVIADESKECLAVAKALVKNEDNVGPSVCLYAEGERLRKVDGLVEVVVVVEGYAV